MARESYKINYYMTGIRRGQGVRCVYISCDTVEGHYIQINFHGPGEPLEPNQAERLYPDFPEYPQLYGCINAPADQYIWYLDILRNEKAWVVLDTDDPGRNELGGHWAMSGWAHLE